MKSSVHRLSKGTKDRQSYRSAGPKHLSWRSLYGGLCLVRWWTRKVEFRLLEVQEWLLVLMVLHLQQHLWWLPPLQGWIAASQFNQLHPARWKNETTKPEHAPAIPCPGNLARRLSMSLHSAYLCGQCRHSPESHALIAQRLGVLSLSHAPPRWDFHTSPMMANSCCRSNHGSTIALELA